MTNRTAIVITVPLLFCILCVAQDEPAKLALRAYHGSAGPFGGEKGASCFMLYSDGRIVQVSSSTAAMGVQDEHGKVTHPQKSDSREYRFPEPDSWQVSSYLDFLQSKALRRLKSYFPPPHPPIDFFETSTVQVFFADGTSKQIQTREYYVASLVEKAKYPSALIILMDKLAELEDKVADKGTPTKGPASCNHDQPHESATKK